MKAMILAAGKGSRLTPFTDNLPKPLLQVMGDSVIEHILKFLRRQNIEDVFINTSHCGEHLQNLLGDGSRYRMNFTYSYEGYKAKDKLVPMPMGSAGGLRDMQSRFHAFQETFLVVCGDAIIDFDLDYVLAFHKANESMATIVSTPVPKAKISQYGVIDADACGRIRQFQEKPSVDEACSEWVSTGIYVFEPEIFSHIPPEGEFDIGGALLPQLVEKGYPVYACQTPAQWIDIGTVNDLWQANFKALYHQIDYAQPKGVEVRPGVFVAKSAVVDWQTLEITGPVYIGPGAIIEPNVKIYGPVIIGANVRVCANSRLSHVVVEPHVEIKSNAVITNQWLAPNFRFMMSEGKATLSFNDNTIFGDSRVHSSKVSKITMFPSRARALACSR